MARLIGPNEAVTVGPTETTTFQGLAVQGTLTVEGRLVVEPAQVTATATDADSGSSTATRTRQVTSTSADADSGSSTTTRTRQVTSTSADTDSGSSTATRERVLTTRRSLTVASGETQTIPSGTTLEKDDVQVSGRLIVEGDLLVTDGLQDADSASSPLTRERPLRFESADADSSTALAREVRTITATAVDTDSATIPLQRLRKLLTTATDSDSASVAARRIRDLAGSGTDVDTSRAVLLPRTRFTDPRAAGIDLLEQTYNWPAAKPDIKRGESVPWKSRENAPEPRIYVTKPTGDELDRFSADGESLTEDETVRFDVWILDGEHPDELARQYRNQIINRLYKYSNDNYSNTEFQEVQPTTSTDFRAQSSGRQTDHYIYTIEVDWHRLVNRV